MRLSVRRMLLSSPRSLSRSRSLPHSCLLCRIICHPNPVPQSHTSRSSLAASRSPTHLPHFLLPAHYSSRHPLRSPFVPCPSHHPPLHPANGPTVSTKEIAQSYRPSRDTAASVCGGGGVSGRPCWTDGDRGGCGIADCRYVVWSVSNGVTGFTFFLLSRHSLLRRILEVCPHRVFGLASTLSSLSRLTLLRSDATLTPPLPSLAAGHAYDYSRTVSSAPNSR
jgi:hypothetical protein